jgi:hypothetical protein
MRLASTILLALVACGGDDAAVDAPITVDIDNGTCGAQLRFTGEYIDWDQDSGFCGIFNATFADGANTDSTAPNGRFDMCIDRGAAQTTLAITPSTTPSECTDPQSTYPIPGLAVASSAVITAGGFWSGRNFSAARQATLGVAIDPAKAQLFVHVEGTPRAVSIDAAHDPSQANAATTWAAGDTGHDVFFPNVSVGAGTTVLSVAGGAIGTGAIPLVAGKMTSVSVIAN